MEKLVKAELLIDAGIYAAVQARAMKEGIQVEAVMERALTDHLALTPLHSTGQGAKQGPALAGTTV